MMTDNLDDNFENKFARIIKKEKKNRIKSFIIYLIKMINSIVRD